MPLWSYGKALMQAFPATMPLIVLSGSLDECDCTNIDLRHGQACSLAVSDVGLQNAAGAADLEIVGDHDHARFAEIRFIDRALQRDGGVGRVDQSGDVPGRAVARRG